MVKENADRSHATRVHSLLNYFSESDAEYDHALALFHQ